MRKIVAELFSSLDGVVASPDQWHGPHKVVFSATLTELDWVNSRPATGDLTEEVTRLKRQPGKDIVVTGSVTLVQGLLRAGLLDELRLLIDPVVVRGGRRLFESEGDRLSCSLVGSRTYTSGTISATYAINH